MRLLVFCVGLWLGFVRKVALIDPWREWVSWRVCEPKKYRLFLSVRRWRQAACCRRVAVTLLFGQSLIPSVASAWCQSLSVTSGSTSCRQRCLTLSDFTEEQRRDMEIVELAWKRPCFEYSIFFEGSKTLRFSELEETIARSFSHWTSIRCEGVPVGFEVRQGEERSECNRPEYVTAGGNSNTFAFIRSWSSRGHASGAFALTTTWFDRKTGEILDADMELNEQHWTWAICPDSGCSDGRIDLENTMTHEMGHLFGLAHSPDTAESTMWACAEEGEVLKRSLHDDDQEGFCDVYSPESFTRECRFEPHGGFDARCKSERRNCGCSVPGKGGSGLAGSLFVLILGVILVRRTRR